MPSEPCGGNYGARGRLLLMGLMFDDRGHPMSPSHANKKGVRYRYYVSQAVLQNRKIRGRVGLAHIRTGHRKYRRRGPSPGGTSGPTITMAIGALT